MTSKNIQNTHLFSVTDEFLGELLDDGYQILYHSYIDAQKSGSFHFSMEKGFVYIMDQPRLKHDSYELSEDFQNLHDLLNRDFKDSILDLNENDLFANDLANIQHAILKNLNKLKITKEEEAKDEISDSKALQIRSTINTTLTSLAQYIPQGVFELHQGNKFISLVVCPKKPIEDKQVH